MIESLCFDLSLQTHIFSVRRKYQTNSTKRVLYNILTWKFQGFGEIRYEDGLKKISGQKDLNT